MPFLILAARIGRAARRLPLLLGLAACAVVVGAEGASAAPLQATGNVLGPAKPSTHFSSGATPVGDVNGDGLGDVAVRVGEREKFAVVFGTRASAGPKLPSDGGAGFEIRIGSTWPERVPVPAGDFDGDGLDDLIVPVGAKAHVVYGAATPGPIDLDAVSASQATSIEVGSVPGPSGIVGMGDFDGDGRDDLVTRAGSGAAILRGGPRLASISATAPNARRISISGITKCYWRLVVFYTCDTGLTPPQPIGDVNGDAKSDLWMPDRRFVLLGRAGGKAMPGTGPDWLSWPTTGITHLAATTRPGGLGDVTGDGIGDLLAFTGSTTGSWSVIPGHSGNNGVIGVDQSDVVKIAPGPSDGVIAVDRAGDVNRDGKVDLAVTSREVVHVVTGRAGPASLTPASGTRIDVPLADLKSDLYYPTSTTVSVQGAGDLDGDGAEDLIAASPWSDTDDLVDRGILYLVTQGPDRLPPALQPRGTTNPEVGSNVTPNVFAAAPAGSGTQLRIVVNEPASVELRFQRRGGGAVLSTETRTGLPEGVTTIAWDGRGRGVDGVPGQYELVLTPVDAAGNRGASQTIPFEITASPGVRPPSLEISRSQVVPAGAKVPPPTEVYPYTDPLFRRVHGSCPDNLTSPGLTPTPQAIPINDPAAGDPCELYYQPPPAQDYDKFPPLPDDLAKFPWKTTFRINGAAPVLVQSAGDNAYIAVPRFSLRNGVNTIEIVDTWDPSQLDIPDDDVTSALNWTFPAAGEGFANAAAGSPTSAAGLRLTPAATNQIGVAVACPAGGLDPNTMTVEFDAEITGGTGAGHGLAFVVFDSKPSAVRKSGANVGFGWVGYSGTAFAINTAKERYNPSNNFFGIASGVPGRSGYPTWLTTSPGSRTYAGSTTRVKVRVKGGLAEFTVGNQQISRAVQFPAGACLGFTAATGTRTQSHVIKNLRVRRDA